MSRLPALLGEYLSMKREFGVDAEAEKERVRLSDACKKVIPCQG